VGCRALLTADRFKSSDYLGMLRTLSLPHLSWLIRFGTDSIPGFLNVDALMSSADERGFERLRTLETQLQPDDAINIQFTSGTTGLPKGATLSHFNILNNGYFVGRALHLSELDRVCIPVPLYHCFGMVLGNLAALTHGAAMLYPAESFDPKATLEAVARERATRTCSFHSHPEPGLKQY